MRVLDRPASLRDTQDLEGATDEVNEDVSLQDLRPEQAGGGRLVGLDVLRGLLIAAVVVLQMLGVPEHPHLVHAPWNGLTITDLVFPALLVVTGISLAYLLKPPAGLNTVRRILRRTIALILVGVLVMNNTGSLDLAQVRLTGVLQTFAVAGLAASVVVLAARWAGGRDRWWVTGAITAIGIGVYQWVFLRASDGLACAVPGGRCSPFHRLDLDLLGASHVYRAGQAGWDPEGVVPMLAATLLVLGGWTAGVLLRDHERTPRWITATGLLAAAGLLLLVVAPALGEALPVNKRLHTPAFQVTTIGWTFALLAGLVLTFDTTTNGSVPPPLSYLRKLMAWPLETLGRNPLTMYVLAHLLTVAAEANLTTDGRPWREAFTQTTVEVAGGAWWGDPLFNAAIGLLAVVFAVAVVMRMLNWRIAL